MRERAGCLASERRAHRRGTHLAVSQCPAIDRAGMQTLLQLDLFKQEVSHQAAKTRVLELKLPNLTHLFALGRNAYSLYMSRWP